MKTLLVLAILLLYSLQMLAATGVSLTVYNQDLALECLL
jgi:hypothetical protein